MDEVFAGMVGDIIGFFKPKHGVELCCVASLEDIGIAVQELEPSRTETLKT
jgi:hypothetical protein